ncbi:hypothetical protein [Methylopila sp. M107]|uniref:hypothetical protein n=1 Tax=Methylopila sp. M107 TaxID=1101190 RepID=UPI0003810159|nr:hypothetical protein [Methylopila sp. M107]
MGAQAKIAGSDALTDLMAEAVLRLSALPAERQDELAQMLLDVAEGDRLLASGDIALTPEQLAEVDAAIAENDFLSEEETEAFFARLRA